MMSLSAVHILTRRDERCRAEDRRPRSPRTAAPGFCSARLTPASPLVPSEMKLKEIDRTAMQAWSPAQQHPIYLATGTSAQQLDATFSTNASLEIFELDLSDPSLDMKTCATFSSSHRYHKLIWGPHSMTSGERVSGVLIAGGENGNVILYDPAKIIAGDTEVIIAQKDKHTGPVRALDVNMFQTNLVASGANESEIYIWDLNNFATPMTPGAKTQPLEDISCIAWNKQVQHILASASPSGRATVWDLRKNEPIIKVSDHNNRVLYELPTNMQWCFDIQWCPRNPAILSAASFDGRISIYSIMGGSTDGLRQKHVDQFGGKLVTFENAKPQQQPGIEQQQQRHYVYVSQVVTEREFLARSTQLQEAVQSEGFVSYCQKKIDMAQADFEKNVWAFLKVNFEEDSRAKYLELLGYRKDDLKNKITSALNLNKECCADGELGEAPAESDVPLLNEGDEGQAAEEYFLGERSKDKKQETEDLGSARKTFSISVSGDVDGLITQALLTGNFESAVDLCLHDNRMADAIILAIAGGQELLSRTQEKYFSKIQSKITRLITAVVTKNWKEIVQSCDLQNWREALAAVLTYARPDEFAALCDLLGNRLESEGDSLLRTQACLCYICAGNVEKLVACWSKVQDGNSPLSLQDLIEKVVILRKAVQLTQAVDPNAVGALLAEKMSQYANVLAAQGSIAAALTFLPANTDQPNIVLLRDRLCRAQGELPAGQEAIKAPYERQPMPKDRAGPVAGQVPGPQASAQQYYQQGDKPPPPGFIMPGAVNPSAPPQQATSPSYSMYSQAGTRPAYPQRPQNGWNDPPALNRAAKKKKVPDNFMPPVPITSPIMNPLADAQAQMQQQPPAAPVGTPSFQPPQLPVGQQAPLGPYAPQALGPCAVPPTTFKPRTEGAPGAPIGNTIQHVQALPTEKITKKPIPEEHLILKTTFEALIQRCLLSASDPQTKRKLDDANKRLEFLYDKLREQTLSPAIVSGLHNIAKSIETRDYVEGLNIHMHIVSTSNFSETSAFMPVLKVVLIQANKLGV
ncbi:UNVERIFIED_CONTAM: hypothetical protein H355_012219 [Colinus virginianus]|nr:hypothetical protein H355_012219 [Colinus virginianus]